MKRNLKMCIISVVISLISFIGLLINVSAESMVDITYVGNDSVTVNDEVTLYLTVKNIEDYENGVVALAGNIEFDEDYLELISATPTTIPYEFNINTAYNYKVFGLSFTTNGFKEDTTIITLVFKTKKIGSTEITFTNTEVCDSFFKYSANVIPKTLNIIEEVRINESKDVTTTTTTSTTTTKIVEEEKTTTEIIDNNNTQKTNTSDNSIINTNTKKNTFVNKYLNFNNIKNNIKNFTNNLYNKICNLFR